MKRIISAFMAALLIITLLAGCAGTTPETQNTPEAPSTPESQEPEVQQPDTEQSGFPTFADVDYARILTEIPADADLDTVINLESRNAKNIAAMKVIFEETTYSTYTKAITKMKKEKTMETAIEALEARAGLVQNESVEDRFWFIWDGVTMPLVDGESFTDEELDTSQMFGAGFEPFAIKYLVEDQSQCKGNIIAVSGGAFLVWSNGSEGYPAAKAFNDLGYNYFLLQRRVGPYSPKDIFMDFQRFIRVVKYHAEKENYGGQDMFAGLGWSGGGGTLMGAVCFLYGDVLPTIYDSDYVPDEIDRISADLDVAMPIYGAVIMTDSIDTDLPTFLAGGSGNKNLPAFYIAHGTADSMVPAQTSIDFYEAVKNLVPAKLTLIEGAEHGFGVGIPPATGLAPGAELWPAEADVFMQANLGHSSK